MACMYSDFNVHRVILFDFLFLKFFYCTTSWILRHCDVTLALRFNYSFNINYILKNCAIVNLHVSNFVRRIDKCQVFPVYMRYICENLYKLLISYVD